MSDITTLSALPAGTLLVSSASIAGAVIAGAVYSEEWLYAVPSSLGSSVVTVSQLLYVEGTAGSVTTVYLYDGWVYGSSVVTTTTTVAGVATTRTISVGSQVPSSTFATLTITVASGGGTKSTSLGLVTLPDIQTVSTVATLSSTSSRMNPSTELIVGGGPLSSTTGSSASRATTTSLTTTSSSAANSVVTVYITPSSTPAPSSSSLSGGAIAGVVIGPVAAIALVGAGIAWFLFGRKRRTGPKAPAEEAGPVHEKGDGPVHELHGRSRPHEVGGAPLHELQSHPSELETDSFGAAARSPVEMGLKSAHGSLSQPAGGDELDFSRPETRTEVPTMALAWETEELRNRRSV
ncbi:hypothetical protein BAUCODRAFT_27541 [Baudoinia panamericana UAMH 10762]|uniref:Mid2 domain-containing protein n=1 Tax=Baudoinia panamericana (strain UAMH 10762) TaxID=717646 RepID=M2MLE7_BAUPA|nr:uncharacterized protein BAUCODRAFT_27541 [Baudoinia panamericana UAMH 10762]EMC92213.1 hypothetical protein BAUCODRAFT_27541 [Baudoinia panamericana UAMH 10762]